jgi:hypothetical protein
MTHKCRKRRVSLAIVVPIVVAVLALLAASPVSAALSATATRAPIGRGSYLVTFTNTGPASIPSFTIVAEGATNITSSGSCRSLESLILCTGDVAPGAVAQVCYSGGPVKRVLLGLLQGVRTTSAPRTACPLAGFKPASSSTGSGTAPTSGSTPTSASKPASAHPWKHRRCIAVYKAWKKAHRAAKAKQRKAERGKLHKLHGCPLSILK